jgi:hypothetical protein
MQLNRLWVILLLSLSAHAATWYVRPDGGTRYSVNMTAGLCDGTADSAPVGTTPNQHCAFGDVRFLWQDGSYTQTQNNFPAYGWIGAGGDTYLVRGSIATGVSYRIGWNIAGNDYDPATNSRWGVHGDAGNSGPPPLLSGTAGNPTRFLGENYQNCSAPSSRTQLHGGWAVGVLIPVGGSSYVDVECMDLTDWAQCISKTGQADSCESTAADYAGTGVYFNRSSTNITLNNLSAHGLANNGFQGPTGTGVVATNVSLVGNGQYGWNADNGDGTTGTGTLLVQDFNISWNGCAEEYPIVDAVPYTMCRDDGSHGNGDGFGTTTAASSPAWNAVFNRGIVTYNTQDGLDALHLTGTGSSMTITNVLAYGNMGQQLKIGGANGVGHNNIAIGNCNAMRYAIPGTPSGYNSNLSDFCRAGSTVKLDLGLNSLTTWSFNTIITSQNVAIEINCGIGTGACTDGTSKLDYRNNIFVGFPDDAAHGFPGSVDDALPDPATNVSGANWPANAGSFYSNNIYFHTKQGSCPEAGETNYLCADPTLTDESWHNYGTQNVTPLAGSPVLNSGVSVAGVTTDYAGNPRPSPPSRGALELASTPPPSSPHSKGLRNAHCPRCRF